MTGSADSWRDTFDTELSRGQVIGSRAGNVERFGVDAFKAMQVDVGALRIISLDRPGWGTTALSYEAVERQPGVAFAALVLNGHNTAQAEPLGEPLRVRFKRWMKGNDSEPWRAHVIGAVRSNRKQWMARRFRHWIRVAWAERRGTLVLLDENLAVGLQRSVGAEPNATSDLLFVMHATGAQNGELWAIGGGRTHRVLPSVMNVPLLLAVIVTDDSAWFLAGGLESTAGLPALPSVRPLAVLPLTASPTLHPTVHQAVSGQIGFAADTRIYETTGADVVEWLAQLPGHLRMTRIEHGTARFTCAGGAGIIRVRRASPGDIEVTWRSDELSAWNLTWGDKTTRLVRRALHEGHEVEHEMATDLRGESTTAEVEAQIVHDGERVSVSLDGRMLFGGWIDAPGAVDEVLIETPTDAAGGLVELLEIVPRTLRLPPDLAPTEVPDRITVTGTSWITDDFDGPAGDLEGRPHGDSAWVRSFGSGRFELSGGGELMFAATLDEPMPGRVVYSVPVDHCDSIELEIEVLPPGSIRGQGERGRATVVFEEDDDNALFVGSWIDDQYDGSSISSFFRLEGYEDLYDAIWTNVGRRITWGQLYRLRVGFDGMLYQAWVNDELVLHRRLDDVHPGQRRLVVRRVGIASNWEWGSDTGSRIHRWTMRSSAEA